MNDEPGRDLREQVRSRYAEAARAILEPRSGTTGECCGSSAGDCGCGQGPAALDPADCFGGPLYGEGETDGLPDGAVQASLGCGNPLAVADLREGERVLDACTLPTAERPLRAADFAALLTDAVQRIERPEPTRLHLDLRPGAEVAARAAGLAAAETECCSFFTFTLTATGGTLSLDVTVPAAHTAILDALAGVS